LRRRDKIPGAAEHPVAAYFIENKPLLARTSVRAFFARHRLPNAHKFADSLRAARMVNMPLTLL
jgi:hypothetical protein